MKPFPYALATALMIGSLTGCKVGPNYKRPVVDMPDSYRGAMAPDIATEPAGTPLGAQKWQSVFTDPVLQQLINQALKNNYDVKIAADHVLEEQAQLGITRSAEFPTFSVGASYDALGLPASLLNSFNNSSNSNSSSTSKNSSSNYYSGGLTGSVAWNLDFWGTTGVKPKPSARIFVLRSGPSKRPTARWWRTLQRPITSCVRSTLSSRLQGPHFRLGSSRWI